MKKKGRGLFMSESKELDKLIEKMDKFRDTHIKRSKTEMFSFFNSVLKKTLVEFVECTEMLLSIVQTEDSITVTISDADTFLLLCDEDRTILKVLSVANAVFIKTNAKGGIDLEMWFRGWEWEEKAKN